MKTKTAIAVVITFASAAALALAIETSTNQPHRAAPSAASPTGATTRQADVVAPDDHAEREKQVQAVLADLDRAGPEAPIYAAMHQEFPKRYDEIVVQMRSALLAEDGPVDRNPGLSTLVQTSMLNMRKMVARSSDASLRKVAAAQYALLGALENESPKACVGYISGSGMTDVPDETTVRNIATLLSVAQIHAAGEAERSPIDRPAPTREMFAALAQRMRDGGATDEQIAALADGRISDLPPADGCRIVRTVYHATLSMTESDAAGIVASLSDH